MRHLLILTAAVLVSPAGAADPPAKPASDAGKGWVDLLDPAAFEKVDARWIRAAAVTLAEGKPNRLAATAVDGGKVWVNGTTGRIPNLVTKADYGDCDLHAEFLIAKGSNAGVKFHGLYELQILDTPAGAKLTGNSTGGIYPRATAKGGYKYLDDGVAPKVNAARKPGEWQTLDVTWQAPRFDAAGKKTAHGVIVQATLNGQVIHENQDVKTPTGANHVKPDTAKGPILLQADHGPVAFRDVRVRPR